MSKLMRNLALLIIMSLLILFFVFFIISLFTFPAKYYLASFRSQWIVANTVIHFFDYMLPFITALLLLGYSYFYAGKKYFRNYSMSGIVSRALILFLFLAFVYTVFQEGIVPAQNQKQKLLKYRSEIARNFNDIYDRAFSAADYSKAQEYLNLYLSIDPGNREAIKKLETIEEITRNRKKENQEIVAAAKKETGEYNEKLRSLYEAADLAFKKADYFHAAYLANLILDLDSNNLRAREMLSSCWQKINSTDLTYEEEETRNFYKDKMLAFQVLFREKNPIKAYYLLKDLKETHPDDPDVKHYYTQAYDQLQGLSFFIEDADRVLGFEGYDDICFLNKFNDSIVQLIRIEKITVVDDGVFCKNIEIVFMSFSDGQVVYHVNYPYGKIYHNELIVRAVSKNNPDKTIKAAVYSLNKSVEYPQTSITLSFSVRELLNLSRQRLQFIELGAGRLWELKKLLHSAGYPLDSVNINLISRLQKPFIFLQICFASLLLGLMFHLRDSKKRRFVYIIFIPVPFILSQLAVKIILYCSRIVTGMLYFLSGYTLTLLLLMGIHVVLLLFLLILLSGQQINE